MSVLDNHRQSIEFSILHDDQTISQVLQTLHDGGIEISKSTLEKRLRLWGIKVHTKIVDTPELQEAVTRTFELGINDQLAVDLLQQQGMDMTIRQFRTYRKRLGLHKRVAHERQDEDNARLRRLLQDEYDDGMVELYGKHHLYTHMRRKYHIVGRERMVTQARLIDPDGFASRRKRAKERRGTYRVKGPNYAWSIDAHCKLQFWGIEVYAAIDAYSRFVIWVYVGVSARTAISVLAQYVRTIEDSGVIPVIIKSDRGAETVLAADLHYQIRSQIRGEIREGETAHPLLLTDTFRYGTSKQNQRIEKWWQDASKSCLTRWRTWFLELKETNGFVKDFVSDRVAFLAIYVPIIRRELVQFVSLWNDHKIRRDNRRGHVSGIPSVMYRLPSTFGGEECAIEVPVSALEDVKHELGDYDLDEYLPPVTLRWCRATLERLGFISDLSADVDGSSRDTSGVRDHRRAYQLLRDAAREHCLQQSIPDLTECEHPTGSRWEPSAMMRAAFAAAGEDYVERDAPDGWDDEA